MFMGEVSFGSSRHLLGDNGASAQSETILAPDASSGDTEEDAPRGLLRALT
jgi:hypothetical protein